MMGQPDIPDDAQEKMQKLQEIQESHEEIAQKLQELQQGLESASRAHDFLQEVGDETSVYRQVDELLFELDYEDAHEHIEEKVTGYQEDIERLEGQQQKLEQRMESLSQEVRDIMGVEEEEGHEHE